MSRSSPGIPWRLAFCLIAACCLLMDLYAFKGPMYELLMAGRGLGAGTAAEVCGQPVTRLELAEAMREQLWKRNEVWASLGPEARKQMRWLVLENLVNDRLLRACRSMASPGMEVPMAAAKREAERMQRQFADAGEFPRRLAAQQLTTKSLETLMQDAQMDEVWLMDQIQPQLRDLGKEARAWYEEYGEKLRISQTWHAAHIFLTRHDETKPDREMEIREIQRQLLAKEKTFAQLAQAHSEDARSKTLGGDLGWFTQERMPADFIAAVQKLKVGQFSEPVQTQLGWHIIIVLERRASRLPAFAEVKDEIAAMLTTRWREAAVQSLLAELRERLKQSVVYRAEIIDRAEPAS